VHVARGLEALPRSDEPVFVVVGVFDGLHLGHAYLLRHLVAEARRRQARPVVITFDHHPDEVLTGSAPSLLCDPHERLALLEGAGVDTTVVVHFDQRMRETPYQAFVEAIAARAPTAGFLMTPDAAFGYERAGTPVALAALGEQEGFDVVVVPPFELDGAAVRSSDVRRAIEAGDLERVSALLGRPHAVSGVPAEERERAVVRFDVPVALPPPGIYEAEVTREGEPGEPARVTVDGGTVVLPPATGTRHVTIAFRASVDPVQRGM
jgi:riboflavin kinase / FMN adenylyltransferase